MQVAHQRILDKLSSQALPTQEPSTTWAGFGSGLPCDGCERPIRESEVEHELEFDTGRGKRTLHFHVACVAIWWALKERPSEPAGPPRPSCPPPSLGV
jgi:hypothetical protein